MGDGLQGGFAVRAGTVGLTGVANPIQPGDGDPRHGKITSYTNHGCRCPLCRAANADYCSRRTKERRRAGLPEGDPRHGTENGYGNYGCRCRACTTAWSTATLARRHRRMTK